MVHIKDKFNDLDEAANSGQKEAIVVISILFDLNKKTSEDQTLDSLDNQHIQKLLSAIDTLTEFDPKNSDVQLHDFLKMMPEDVNKYYHYEGGLTIPPYKCKGNINCVKWIIFRVSAYKFFKGSGGGLPPSPLYAYDFRCPKPFLSCIKKIMNNTGLSF